MRDWINTLKTTIRSPLKRVKRLMLVIFNGYIEDIPDSTDNGEIVGDDSSRDQRNEDRDPILGSLINMFDELVSE